MIPNRPLSVLLSRAVDTVDHTQEQHARRPRAGDADYLGGIPLHEFSSNDGWHVTDKECTEALAAYETSREHGDQPASRGVRRRRSPVPVDRGPLRGLLRLLIHSTPFAVPGRGPSHPAGED